MGTWGQWYRGTDNASVTNEEWRRDCQPILGSEDPPKTIVEGCPLCLMNPWLPWKELFKACPIHWPSLGTTALQEKQPPVQKKGKGRRNSRQHPNFLGAWLIALISQPVTIKPSGMEGNNTRMVPKIRPPQLQCCSPGDWNLSVRLDQEPGKRSVQGVIKGGPALISAQCHTLSAPVPGVN